MATMNDGATIPATPPAPAPTETETPRGRAPRRRSTLTLTILLVAVLVAGILAGVSRAQVAGRLATSDASLSATRADLEASMSQVEELEARAGVLEGRTADALAEVNDTRESLTACQDLFVMGAEAAMQGVPPGRLGQEFASMLISCFEGRLPKAIF